MDSISVDEKVTLTNEEKIENYDKLQENFNKLMGKYNEEHANVLNLRYKYEMQEKNHKLSDKEKDKKIEKLEKKLSAYESKQVDIFGL